MKRVESNGKYGFFDQSGKTVIEPIYDRAEDFNYGLAAVNLGAERDPQSAAKRGGKWGYIDTKGRVVVPITLDYAATFSDGLAKVGDEQGTRFIDTQGKTVLNLGVGTNCGEFSEGVCPVYQDLSLNGGYFKTRYIDHAGETAFSVDGYGREFHEGMAVLTVRDPDNKDATLSGFINRQGRMAIKPSYAEARPFSEGLAAVRLEETTGYYGKGDRWGYIDVSGKTVISPRFNEAYPFVKGIARVHEGGELRQESLHAPPEWEGGQWKGIDKTGEDAARFFTADAEKAKAALLDLIRNHRDLFIGKPDPDHMKPLPLRSCDLQEPQQFYWAGFVIDVKQRTYHADVVREQVAWFYSGAFEIDASGQWTASKPEVTEARFPPHQ